VAMNKRQAEEIEFLLEAELRRDPLLQDALRQLQPPLFVKNLENVQGDERDVIIISTTYGPSAAGEKAAQRFGPINSAVGHRRLNVVATRAKQRVEVVSSLRPEDVLLSGNASAGVRALRDYLSYVFLGTIPDHGFGSGRPPESPFEEAVAFHLKSMGHDCEPQIGVAGFFVDIGIRHPHRPGEFLLGVECDGARYHSARSVRDRDRLRQEILEKKGWRIHRIWSTSWYFDRGAEIRRLRTAIADALAADAAQGRPAPPASAARPAARAYGAGDATQRAPTVQQRVDAEEADREELLQESLERYWRQEIQPLFPVRTTSVLNHELLNWLVRERPRNVTEFTELIPAEARRCDARQHRFLENIFSLIREFG
jgi:hypothetical protein